MNKLFLSITLSPTSIAACTKQQRCVLLENLRKYSSSPNLRANNALPPIAPSQNRRVVITGIGVVSPLGVGARHNWKSLLSGGSGIRPIPSIYSNLPSKVVASVPRGTSSPSEFSAANFIDRASTRTQSADFIAFAIAAAQEALEDAGLQTATASAATSNSGSGGSGGGGGGGGDSQSVGPYSRDRFGVSLGSGIGGIEEVGAAACSLNPSPATSATAPTPPPSTRTPTSSSSSAAAAASSAAISDSGLRRLSPFFVPRILANMAAGNVSIRFGLRGPLLSPSTACATGAHAIGDAFRLIKHGYADAMLAGGTEASIGGVALSGFSRAKALSTTEATTEASRPFDAGRDGFVLGEGAGALTLECLDSAVARGARIYAEVRGYGACGDAYHVTQPRRNGDGALRAMVAALVEGGVLIDRRKVNSSNTSMGSASNTPPPLLPPPSTSTSDWFASDYYDFQCPIDYINAHATSTPVGDDIEGIAIGRLLGSALTRARLQQKSVSLNAATTSGASPSSAPPSYCTTAPVSVSSNKGAIGHLLGAAGAVESIFTILAIKEGLIPSTANLRTLDESLPVDVCTFLKGAHEERRVSMALKNSFGFGGTNCSLLFSSYSP